MSSSKAIIWAAKRGDRAAMLKAIDQGADLNTQDVGGWTPLLHAAWRGDVAAVELLIQAGADVNHGDEKHFTALFAAVLGEHAGAIVVLLRAGAKVAALDGEDLSKYVQKRTSEKSRKTIEILEQAMAEQDGKSRRGE